MSISIKPQHHAALRETLTFGLRLTCETGLHIGGGKNSQDLVGSDLPIIRNGEGDPMIPGSSLRGVLRAGIHSLIDATGLEAELSKPEIWEMEDPNNPSNEEQFLSFWNTLNLVEQLFGGVGMDRKRVENASINGYGSRLHFSDLKCISKHAQPALRDGVAISRETRTAAGGALYDFEAVPAGTVFEGRVRLINPAPHEMGLLAQALWMLNEGILLLGGKKARGLGWVKVETTSPSRLTALDILNLKKPENTQFGPVAETMNEAMEQLRELIGG